MCEFHGNDDAVLPAVEARTAADAEDGEGDLPGARCGGYEEGSRT